LSNAIAQSPCSLPIDTTSGNVTYQQIYLAEGLTKDEIHAKAVEWISISARSATNVIQLNDKENGSLVVKFNYPIRSAGGLIMPRVGEVWCMLHIVSKDGKYKFYMSNFRHTYSYNARNYDCGSIESVINAGCKCKNGAGSPEAYAKAFAQGIKDGVKEYSAALHKYITDRGQKIDDF